MDTGGWMGAKWIDRWVDQYMDRLMMIDGQTDGWMGRQMGEWIDSWVDRWVVGWMYKKKHASFTSNKCEFILFVQGPTELNTGTSRLVQGSISFL